MTAGPVPVLEVGGTHVTAALVDGDRVVSSRRTPLDSGAPRDEILDALATAACELGRPHGNRWGVAIPGPFEYEAGIGRFRDVGKFDALDGVDVGAALRRSITPRPREVRFINDADAFGLGEVVAGAARGADRAVCLTVGTGIGSAFVAAGAPVNDGPLVPPDGSAHLLEWDGRPLEESVSRRAIRRLWEQATGRSADVHEIAALALAGDARAAAVLVDAMGVLGRAIGPWVARFRAEVVVIGGSIAASWTLVGPAVLDGLRAVGAETPVLPARDLECSALVGAAAWASRTV